LIIFALLVSMLISCAYSGQCSTIPNSGTIIGVKTEIDGPATDSWGTVYSMIVNSNAIYISGGNGELAKISHAGSAFWSTKTNDLGFALAISTDNQYLY